MTEADRSKYLKVALVALGIIFIFGMYPMTIVWPSGWIWHEHGQSEYLQMIVGIYATLGFFLLLAAKNPPAHRSLILFTVWSSVVHGGIMGVQALMDARHTGHLYGDVPALFLIAALLRFLMPRTGAPSA